MFKSRVRLCEDFLKFYNKVVNITTRMISGFFLITCYFLFLKKYTIESALFSCPKESNWIPFQ